MSHVITTNEIADILRAQAWARAKGEMDAALLTFYGDSEKFRKINDKIQDFIHEVDSYGLME